MRKRLRKKKYLGEFQQLGFYVWAKLRPEYSEIKDGHIANNELLYDWFDKFSEFLWNIGCCCGGALGNEVDIMVSRNTRRTCTEEHRAAVRSWLVESPAVVRVGLSELADIWHFEDSDHNRMKDEAAKDAA